MNSKDNPVEKIIYVKGDATYPVYVNNSARELRIIAHICNDINRWGKGFVLALSNRWPALKDLYHRVDFSKELGTNQPLIQVTSDISVCNMIAQHDIRTKTIEDRAVPPIRYEALRSCLNSLVETINANRKLNVGEKCVYFENFDMISIHTPRIGCGLAGGKWECIEPIIKECLVDRGFTVLVYDLE